jgi:hypothetical protein
MRRIVSEVLLLWQTDINNNDIHSEVNGNKSKTSYQYVVKKPRAVCFLSNTSLATGESAIAVCQEEV